MQQSIEASENSIDRRNSSLESCDQSQAWHLPLIICLFVFILFLSSKSEAGTNLSVTDSQLSTHSHLSISSETLNFGDVPLGSNANRQLTLTHRLPATDPENIENSFADVVGEIVIDSLFLDELDEQSYSTDFSGPQSLYPGQSLQINIIFTPKAYGKTLGSLFITHSGKNAVEIIRFSGQGVNDQGKSVTLPDLASRAAPAFGKSHLSGLGSVTPTSLQFGPDGRLYVADMYGQIKIHTVQRNSANQYQVTSSETLNQIKTMTNHNDDGSVNSSLNSRLVTGIYVTGSALAPVIYVNSSDPRIGGGASGATTNLDTNSSVLSKIVQTGNGWQKIDLVRGLPRSEENHHANGMALSPDGTKLYVAMGGNTNMGAVSNNFVHLPEYALSAAILEVDLAQIGNTTYDLPTLDDEDRPGTVDANDPFGGNRGKNQAKLVPGGPVQVYAPGFRNAYDVIITKNGRMYSWDNGPNAGWGDIPVNSGVHGECTNGVNEPGQTLYDALHFINGPGYYAGHANPTRGNQNNKFNSSNPQSPVPASNPIECDFRGSEGAGIAKHPLNPSLVSIPPSTNGIAEYSASNFGGAMQGNLLAAAFNDNIYRVQLNANGSAVTSNTILFSNVDQRPLDLVAQGDNDIFPGTIWASDFSSQRVVIFEPNDYLGTNTNNCVVNSALDDSDADGFSNADEIANGTNPCSAADLPADADQDFISDLLDPDDDNDGLPDTADPFSLDEFNGAATSLGVSYDWENNSPSAGGLANLGFSGLMTNGVDDYRDLFDLDQMTISGAAGVVTIDHVSNGDATNNTQEYAFQFGVNVNTTSPVFRARTRVLAPFAGTNPTAHQSMGLFIGTGDQDNYIKLVINSNGTQGGFQFAGEESGIFNLDHSVEDSVYGADSIDLYIEVDPSTQTASALYRINSNGQNGSIKAFGSIANFPASWVSDNTQLAVGIISTSYGAQPFSATWDLIEVIPAYNTASNLAPTITLGSTDTAVVGVPRNLNATINDDGLPSSTITSLWTQTSGPGTVVFGDPNTLATTATFPSAGQYSLTLLADDGQLLSTDVINFNVSQATANTVVWRINAGGPLISSSDGDWLADNPGSHNHVNTGSIYYNPVAVDLNALPSHVPASVMQSFRYDPYAGAEMQWNIPVLAGDYDVRLYFAEVWTGAHQNGKRIFNVDIEGSTFSNIDVHATAGPNAATMISATVTSDNNLDIDFSHVLQNPIISAIEIVAL